MSSNLPTDVLAVRKMNIDPWDEVDRLDGIIDNLQKELEQQKEWVKSHQKSVEIAFEKRNKALEELKNAKDHIKTLYDELNRGTQERHGLKEKNFELENTICRLLVIKEEHQKEIESLKAELAKERGVVDFYANPENWIFRNTKTWRSIFPDFELIKKYEHPFTDWVGTVKVGGKLARQRQRERDGGNC